MSNKKPAIFLDRDGVINHNRPDYVKTWDEFVFLPNVFVPFRRIAKSKYLVVIISNQSPIGRGIVQKAVVDEINMLMSAEIERHKGRVDAIYYCPHAPEDHCDCRKPEPGMFFQAAQELGIDLANSFYVGDAVSDVQAALRAGCRPIMVLSGRGEEQLQKNQHLREIVPVVKDLAAALDLILGD
ncbi:MAG: D-glycero-beta-D-manno-heptose 1,7-bisphosphate 7-phosphatase [Anaerolineales bacterium]|nr:D-glycero-beta-D-manno-heptose 1,7-bisphosphate 7-phosphatase [Anaerolineales bacterium]